MTKNPFSDSRICDSKDNRNNNNNKNDTKNGY